MNKELISHTSTRHKESYIVRFDNKEFLVMAKDCRKHHKEYDEISEIEIIQVVSMSDDQRVRKIIFNELETKKKIRRYSEVSKC